MLRNLKNWLNDLAATPYVCQQPNIKYFLSHWQEQPRCDFGESSQPYYHGPEFRYDDLSGATIEQKGPNSK